MPDCTQSLVINPDFQWGAEGWTPELDMRQAFAPADAEGNLRSGSLAVINASQSDTAPGLTMGGSRQCVPATAATSYDVYLNLLLTNVATGTASAGAALQFFTGPDCSGTSAGTFAPPPFDAGPSGWRVWQANVLTPPLTRSMLLRLVVVKPFKQAATQVLFDNVLLKRH